MAVRASEEIAAYAVVVDAVDEEARRFYEHNGFESLLEDQQRMLVSMESLRLLIRPSPESLPTS
jgi:hypothetical protein